jgi:hypothetical protein
MKNIFTFLAAVLLTATTYAQIGINNENPDASAALDITSTTGGLLPPRMTTTQRDAISAAKGLVLFNTTTNTLQINEGDATTANWVSLSPAATCGLSIGDTHQGGIIFYLDATGCHGLVAKATDEAGTYQWSSTNFQTCAWASGIYGGAQNTKKSIAIAIAPAGAESSTCPAASVCDNLVSGGYTDWYLPSKDELDMMYVNLHLQGLGNFNYFYWSSTEYDGNDYDAWVQVFFTGSQYNGGKSNTNGVRAVRAF